MQKLEPVPDRGLYRGGEGNVYIPIELKEIIEGVLGLDETKLAFPVPGQKSERTVLVVHHSYRLEG